MPESNNKNKHKTRSSLALQTQTRRSSNTRRDVAMRDEAPSDMRAQTRRELGARSQGAAEARFFARGAFAHLLQSRRSVLAPRQCPATKSKFELTAAVARCEPRSRAAAVFGRQN